MASSDFLIDAHFENVQRLDVQGSTSLSFIVTKDGKQYFLKRLRPELQEHRRYRSAFFKEYEVGRRVESRYVVKYEGINEDSEGLYLLMEHVNGQTLKQKLEEEPSWFGNGRNLERMFKQLLMALRELHAKNVLFLDLSCENVMLANVSNDVKLIDLGCCVADSYCTTAGCTRLFAAPEVLAGVTGEFDARADIYAAGKLIQHIADKTGTKLSNRMQRIVRKCTKKLPSNRYASADDVLYAMKTVWERWRKAVVTSVLLIISFCSAIGIGTYMYTENSFYIYNLLHWLMDDKDADGESRYVLYDIVPGSDSLCQVVGAHYPNVYIRKSVRINNKTYRTIGIADKAFCGNRDILSVYIPEGIEYIGHSAFISSDGIASIELPNSVVQVGQCAFSGIGTLENIKLSSNLKKIPENMLAGCRILGTIVVPEGVEEIGLDAFALCGKLKTVRLPSTLRKLSRGVFWKCFSLEEIRLPASLEEIGIYSFFYCDALRDVYNYSPVPQRIAPIFNKTDFTLHVPKGSEEAYRNAEGWCQIEHIVGDL